VTYVLAVLALAAACVLWYLVQRWAGTAVEPGCPEAEADCADCERREVAGSPSAALPRPPVRAETAAPHLSPASRRRGPRGG
jgi:hypothetical protein